MGWESSLSVRGWECYSCLENFKRDVTVTVNCEKTPPPAMVVSPHFVELIPQPLPVKLQSVLDDFDSFLENL